jgi:type IV secretory pathway VirB10-like protein
MILACSVLLALSTGATAGQIYKWVDGQGNVHFGSQPPEGQDAAAVNPNVSQPKAAPKSPPHPADDADPEQQKLDEKVKEEVAKQDKERKEYCQRMRNDLAMLKNNPRLRVEDGDSARRMTEEERQSRIAENEKKIGEHCR